MAATLAAGGLALAADPPRAGAGGKGMKYGLAFDARIVPTEREARVSIRIESPEGYVRSLLFRAPPERYRNFKGEGDVSRSEEGVLWKPKTGTSVLRYEVAIDHLRGKTYDARCAEDWAIFRGEDLVPRVRVDFEDGARSESSLRLRVPDGWSIAAPYKRLDDGRFDLSDPYTSFDRPKGWFTVGELGVRREKVAGVRVAIAGPRGQRMHRMDQLALLRWTLPEMRKIAKGRPPRLLVVGAGDPMWRGGLSGPNSLFLHNGLPLISNDVTSPLLHELMHTFLRIRPGEGGDWIVEGLAELYSLELLERSGTISRKRFEKALERMRERGRGVRKLEVAASRGPVTARAVTVLHALDETIREESGGKLSLDDVVRVLVERRGEITTAELRSISEGLVGKDMSGFFSRNVGSGG